MAANSRLLVGVVGCGYWGKNLVRNFYELGALRAICDVQQENIDRMVKSFPVESTTLYDQFLDIPDIQGVVIATPAAQHFELAKKAILAGKDVFVEKPLALRASDGLELVQLARRHSRILMVGHLLQYHPAVTELRRMVHAGEFGRIDLISSTRLNFGKLRTEEDILWSFAPHDISAILYLLDEFPLKISAHGTYGLSQSRSDATLTTFKFSSGVNAHVLVSWMYPFKEQKLIIVGNQQMAVFDDTEPERKLVLYPHRVDWINRVPIVRKAEGQVVPIDRTEPLRLECQHFLDCMGTRRTPQTDGENGVRVLRILEACGRSVQLQGQPIDVVTRTQSYFVEPTAVVDEPCEIGDGTKIWHFSHVMAKSRIGRNCILGQNVHVAPNVIIGDNAKIQNNVSLYTGVELEQDVFCGPSMVFTNVITPRSHVNRKSEYQRTLVKQGASLGANSTIVCGVTIGEYAFIGAGAVVTSDVPDYALMVGVPARQIGWVCRCGVRLTVSANEGVCPACNTTYVVDQQVTTEANNGSKSGGSRKLAASAGQS